MADFEQGDIIRVPFPYTDKDTRQRRPALVVSSGPIGEANALLWVADYGADGSVKINGLPLGKAP